MFLFQPIPWYSWVAWFVVLGALIGLNEITRRWKWVGLGFFVLLPLLLTLFVWPVTAGPGSSTGTWFHWVKVYSALAGTLGFMAIRYWPKLSGHKWALLFPPAILAINIAEACVRDFQVGAMNANGLVDGVFMLSGPWNWMNGVAGLINLITICGWTGIIISRDPSKDMIWPDMLWFWVIAYDLWNFAYVYNCVGDHSFYAGAALLISCTIPAFFIKKGAWLQHRAATLALWMMFTMAVPGFVTGSAFAVDTSHSPVALFTVSAISLAANVAVLAYQGYVIVRDRLNPLTDELYTGHRAYQEVLAANQALEPVAEPVTAGQRG
ncbi:DUF5692 family protein [Propionicimonas sp.]|uniref:DUF5692 family protein n=1 Tax=Propionicimonas sp. TaxID=1955623 RepID=UPI0017C72B9E|nr:DUF5692 family protein [Propionicimonas sp.]MBU3976876.1 hypothetical protein [Actinomycetota bacterium]MBA3019565.1 hypothetical protein [Propionicimonas sp.]MBU3986971.1 hypothetical protein [Actinomycetota bacterium]MBU4006883.1 hypothetical protein [Actinomycetota bacterium]MBU4065583.1 hypothetical protein [Actinomycetota bacterium]